MTEAWSDSRTPALAIVARGDQIRTVSPNEYVVRSQSTLDREYKVKVSGGRWACECPFYQETKVACIHIFAVRFREGFRVETPLPPNETCAKCGSAVVVHSGIRHNRSGDVSRLTCRACGFRGAARNGFQRRRADPAKIALALDLYFRGMSVRKVSDHFAQVHNLKISHVTVYRWVVHFGKLAAEWMDRQGARTGDRWHVDETVVNVNGRNDYLWNVMDSESRFLLATHVSHGRSLSETRTPLRKAKAVTPDRPAEIFTDGMNAYPEAIHREFGRRHREGDPGPWAKQGNSRNWAYFSPHRVVPSIRAPESNNRIERFHGTEKERFKVMRAFDNPNGTANLAEGFRAHYNLVRDHSVLGTTPGVAAGIPALSGFRWLELLKMATPQAVVSRNETGENRHAECPD